MVEYGLIVAVVSLMALSAVTLVGDSTEDTFDTIAAELEVQGTDQGLIGSESDSDESDGQSSDTGDSDSSSDSDQDDEQGSDDEENLDQQSEDDAGNVDDEQDPEGDEGSDDTGDDSQVEEDESPGPPSNPIGSDSKFYWWNSTKHGGNGAWTASVTYSNDTNRHQYLDLEIIRVDEKGKGPSANTRTSTFRPTAVRPTPTGATA